jgi:hypothetical protein
MRPGVTMLLCGLPVLGMPLFTRSNPPEVPTDEEAIPPVGVMPELPAGVRQAASLDVPMPPAGPRALPVTGRFQLVPPFE